MQTLFCIAIALAAGLFMSRLAKVLSLPAVTAYLVAGIVIGPYCLGQFGITGLGFTSTAEVKALDIISNVALGFIAFSIGNEFRISQLKKIGKQATVVAVLEATTATVLVDAAMIGLHFILGEEKLPLAVCITLGAVAAATAPAATLMVVRQYKAKGPVTSVLLPVVALDDAVGLILFAVSFGIAKALISGAVDVISIVVEPLIEIIMSLVLGLVSGLVFTFSERFFKSNSKRLSMSITFVILTVAISMLKFSVFGVKIGFSTLLVCMMLGSTFCNICDFSEELMGRVDKWTAPLFILFFVLSGAELEIGAFSDIAIVGIGLVYMGFRSAGKCLGAFTGSKLMKCEPQVSQYLGITLLPQAGVALGMSLTAQTYLGAEGQLVRNIVLFAVMIYELIGPLLTKIALTKAGEIEPKLSDERSKG